MSEPGSEWRVRAGVGLLAAGNVPMSDAQREAVARETEKERLADEAAAKLAAEVKAEADAERAFFGVEKRTVGDVIAQASAAQDRQDRRDARIEREAAEILGRPEPRHRPYMWEIAKKQAELFEHEQSPATVGQLHEVQGKLAQLSAKLFAGRKKV